MQDQVNPQANFGGIHPVIDSIFRTNVAV